MYHNSKRLLGGISEGNRRLLAILHQRMTGPFSAPDAANFLSLDVPRTRRFLAYLASRGWLARVRRGWYLTVPLDADKPAEWREDPWVVAAKTFSECYVGGWSACEHWGLTEQIFREIVVFTTRRVRYRKQEIQSTPFRLIVIPLKKLFGVKIVWRGRTRVQVSDPTRTVIDILDTPPLGGGLRHVAEVLEAYFVGDHRSDKLLVAYGDKLGNHAVFKRLGYLIETLGIQAPDLVARCIERKSPGLTLLDPSVAEKGKILRRWNLRVNIRFEAPRQTT